MGESANEYNRRERAEARWGHRMNWRQEEDPEDPDGYCEDCGARIDFYDTRCAACQRQLDAEGEAA